MKIIENKRTGATLIEWKTLQELQPKNFKHEENKEKTKKSIIELGFADPFDVWINPKTQEPMIVDGHQRKTILYELIDEGYQVPEELPCTFFDNTKIKTEKQAVKYLVRVFNGKKNQINKESLIDFAEAMHLSVDDIPFDDLDIKIDMDDIEVEKLETPEEEENEKDFQEIEQGGNARKTMHFTLYGEQIELVNRKIAECKKSEEFNYCETFGNEDQNGNALYCLLSRL